METFKNTSSCNRVERATQLFSSGYNCAQAVVGAFADLLESQDSSIISAESTNTVQVSPKLHELLKVSAGFGAGIGGLRKTCGTVSGLVFVAGILKGDYDVNDLKAKTAFYDTIKKLISTFEEKHGTTICKELLQKASCEAPANPSPRTAEYYKKRPCIRYVISAVEILEASLLNND